MLLRRFNFIFAILVILLVAYGLIFDSTSGVIFYLLPIMFLLFGIEYVKGKNKRLGYFYLFTFSLVFLTAIYNTIL